MTKVLFVDHAFHELTDSSTFFVQALSQRFDVTHIYAEPRQRQPIDWDAVAAFDIVVLWQLDYLAPLFLARGHRTVVVPMFDGSASLPQVHWAAANGACFVNFSRTLHERVRLLGVTSLLVKYFPEPASEDELPIFDGLRVFLWQRRPDTGINTRLVSHLFSDQLSSLHVHNVPDDPANAERYAAPEMIGDAPVTMSGWFSDRADYYRVLQRANVFVAPRPAEGIGLAMLEAMARGMLIVANDLPVHNEYISNWVNGVLFNAANVGEANFSSATRIARMGWRTVQDGRRRWLASLDSILAFVDAAPAFRPAPSATIGMLDRDLVRAYLAGGEVYERFLLRVLPSLTGRERLAARAVTARRPPPAAPVVRRDATHARTSLATARRNNDVAVDISFAHGAARKLLGRGWSFDEDFGVWIEGGRATLSFHADPGGPVQSLRVLLVAMATGAAGPRNNVDVRVNGATAVTPMRAMGGGVLNELAFDVVPTSPLEAADWEIEISCDRTQAVPPDSRQLSIALVSLSIVFVLAAASKAAPVCDVTSLASPHEKNRTVSAPERPLPASSAAKPKQRIKRHATQPRANGSDPVSPGAFALARKIG